GAPRGSHPVTLGAPELVDAFADGWQVSGADLRALGVETGAGASGAAGADARHGAEGPTSGDGTGFTVSLVWTPQRWAWTGIAISGASIFGCVVLALLPARVRRRRAAGRAPRGARRARSSPPGSNLPLEPLLGLPCGAEAGRHLRWWTVAGLAVLTGALGAAISTPYAGVALAVAVGGGLTFRRLRILGAAAAVGLLVAAGTVVVVGQILHPAASGGDWPAAYNDAATLAAMAVAFLGADAVVDYAMTPSSRESG
ncbi:MAG TPA: hypothetical protein VMD28_04170, partial [Acidimicrobiales bacterium]|nr:hypothetical protein [Acidimicrobiales bacterium]